MKKAGRSRVETVCTSDMDIRELAGAIKKHSQEKKRPDGSHYLSLLYKDEKYLAEQSGCSLRQIQILALEHTIIPERYVRNQTSLSFSDQIALLESHICIAGLGGLGGSVTEMLARIGIGRLTLVDGDRFDESNLNRQLLSNINTIDMPKAQVAADYVSAINPAVEVISHVVFIDQLNVEELIGDADIVIDCLDTIPARFVLQNGCRLKKTVLISAAIGGKSGQVTVIYPEDHGLEKIYGDPKKVLAKGVEKKIGTLAYTATTIAALECSAVVSVLTRKSSKLRNGLLMTDLDDYSMIFLDFQQ